MNFAIFFSTIALLLAGQAMAAADDAKPPNQVARQLHVDPATGDDRNDGIAKPVKTISQAIKFAQPGDTIHLQPVVYRDYAGFYNKRGEPARPVTLDGHGATLEGSEPLDPATWREVSPGLFQNDQLLPRLDDAIIGRWFFLWDGKMNHMNRTSKGPSAPFKKPEELQPGEWTFVKDDARKLPNSAQIFGTFFLKLPAGQKLADAHIAVPVRSAGVQMSGDNRHLVIRNLTAAHVYNDGYNIHGHCEDVVFENIRAIECGDDGISAHETAQYRVEGFVSLGNSTGLCDTGESNTHYKNVFIRDCIGYDVFFISHGSHSIENAVVESSAARAVSVGRDSAPEGACVVRFKNVLVRRVGGGPQEFRISAGAKLEAERCTFENLMVQATPGSDVNFRKCLITGEPKPELLIWKDVTWRGEGNVYDVKSLRVEKTNFTPQTFADFQKLTLGENGSHWSERRAGTGADEDALRKLVTDKQTK